MIISIQVKAKNILQRRITVNCNPITISVFYISSICTAYFVYAHDTNGSHSVRRIWTPYHRASPMYAFKIAILKTHVILESFDYTSTQDNDDSTHSDTVSIMARSTWTAVL